MAVFDNMNKTYSPGVAPGIKEYYERKLLENAKPELVHARDAQKRTLPLNNGKTVEFRRFTPFEAATTPLSEGVTPQGQELKQTAFTAMVKSYGRHVEASDELDWYHLDNIHQETAKLLTDQAMLTLDTVARDPLHAGLNVQYAGNNTSRAAIDATDVLTGAEIKKAVRTLKRNNCKPFPDGFYHAIVHPDTVYDLTADPMWIDIAKYQDKAKVEKYELGTMYKVKFFESTNAMVFRPKNYLFGTTASLTITAYNAATRTLTYSGNAVTDDVARELTGQFVYVNVPGSNSTSTNYIATIESINVAAKTMLLRYAPENLTYATGTTVVPYGAGASGADVYSTIVYGADAFGSISLGGSGDNIEVIMNPPGSSGALDPLAQRGTIAWKVKGFCSVILQDTFIVRIEHGATA